MPYDACKMADGCRVGERRRLYQGEAAVWALAPGEAGSVRQPNPMYVKVVQRLLSISPVQRGTAEQAAQELKALASQYAELPVYE